LYAEAYYIVAHPGTAVLEASLVQSPVLAFSKIEFPSYLIGRFLLRIPCITLPNLITKKNLVSEVLSYKNSHLKKEIPYITENILKNISKTSKHKNELIALQRACEGVTIQNLTLEFFMNIFDRDTNHSRLSKG
jgi:lipid-A-disaccharide synthase